jgi:hypothetical protein
MKAYWENEGILSHFAIKNNNLAYMDVNKGWHFLQSKIQHRES